MNFQGLGKIEEYQFYLDIAFAAAKKAADNARQNTNSKQTRLNKSKDIELTRVKEAYKMLEKHMWLIVNSFPSLDGMTEFYKELIRSSLDYDQIKKSAGAIAWAANQVNFFGRKYEQSIKRSTDIKVLNQHRRDFYGRVSSVLKQVRKDLVVLEEARRTMKTYPSIKQKLFTVAIAGFPNVGKSTLLAKLTGSKPEIKNYAFTTKSLNVASFGETQKIQCIDTPGTLNRQNKMNAVERLAEVAMKYEADLIVFVFDPTYEVKDQVILHKRVLEYDKPVLNYVSKTDIYEVPDEIMKFEPLADPNSLKKELLSRARKFLA